MIDPNETIFQRVAREDCKRKAAEYAKENLSSEPPEGCPFVVGQEVIVRNGYGHLLAGFHIVGFRDGGVYLDWDCWWVDKSLKDIYPARSNV